MGIIYLISALILITTFILIKKTDKTLDIISFIGITIVVFLSYNVFVCYILTFILVPQNLLILSLVNLIFSTPMIIIIAKSKKIQKYKFEKINLVNILIILIVTVFVSCLNFGIPFEVKYETGDPATHYYTSVLFSKDKELLTRNIDEVYGALRVRRIGSYVNSGIIMECFSNIIQEIDYYNIFILFGIFTLFMTGYIMYCTLEKFTNIKYAKILALIISLIYVLGYPLNSLLFGFEYLSLGILLIGTILHFIYYFENEELKFRYYIIIFALLNFNVFCSYYLFVPFTYSALWIYFCIYSKKNSGKLLCKKNILLLIITLIIPFLLGYIYHFATGIYNIFDNDFTNALKNAKEYSSHIINSGFGVYGYIYVNFYSNMLPFIPLIIYYMYKKVKEKKLTSFETIIFVLLIIFIVILLIGRKFEKVSTYYIMKNYYVLWIFMLYFNFRGLMYIFEKNKAKVISIIVFYIILIILTLAFTYTHLINDSVNEFETPLSFVEIFGVNKTIINDRNVDLNIKQIDILKYAINNLDFENNQIEVLGDTEQLYWSYSFLQYINNEDTSSYKSTEGQQRLNNKALTIYNKIGKVDYIIYFNKNRFYDKVEDILFENAEIIYQNESGGIIKYIK